MCIRDRYGGVPLVKETQDPVESSVTPRATSKETYEFILDDLNKACLLYTSLPCDRELTTP